MSLTALAVAGLGLLALGLTWRGRMRAGMTERLPWRRRHLLSVMLLTAATAQLRADRVRPAALRLLQRGAGLRRDRRRAGPAAAAGGVAAGGAAGGPAGAAAGRPPPDRRRAGPDGRRHRADGARPARRCPYWLLVVPMALFGFGFLVAQTAWTNAFMSAMPDAIVGASAGICKATAFTGSALAGALLGTVRAGGRPGGLRAPPGGPGALRGAERRGGQRPGRRAARGRHYGRRGPAAAHRRARPAVRLP